MDLLVGDLHSDPDGLGVGHQEDLTGADSDAAAAPTPLERFGWLNVVGTGAGVRPVAPIGEPPLELAANADLTHLTRPGRHIGPMAGSKAKHEIWLQLADCLAGRSEPRNKETKCQRRESKPGRPCGARGCTGASRS